jgi:uncharacterized protein (TIGR02118 family)
MQRVVVTSLKRRTDLAQPLSSARWLDRHRALAEQLTGLRRCVISLAVEAQDGPFDGMAELWFDGLATLGQVMASEVVKEAQRHSVAHTSDRIRLVVEEHRLR